MLQCLHSFCSECLKTLPHKTLRQEQVCQEQEHATEPHICTCRYITCPVCEEDHILPTSGTEALPKDFRKSYDMEVAKIKKKIDGKKRITCDHCKHDFAKSSGFFCISCIAILCSTCSEWCERSRHQFERINEDKDNILEKVPHKPVHCQIHSGEPLKLYCITKPKTCTCCQLICQYCTHDNHKGHNCLSAAIASREEKINLTSELVNEDLKSKTAKVEDVEKNCDSTIQSIKNTQKEHEEYIEHTIEDTISRLRRYKSTLIEGVKKGSTDKISALSDQKEQLVSLKKKLTEAEDAIQVATRVHTPEELLSVKETFVKRLQTLSARVETTNLRPCKSNTVICTLDAQKLKQGIESLCHGRIYTGSCPANATISQYTTRVVAGNEKRFLILTHSEDGKRYPHGGERVDIRIESSQACEVNADTRIQDNKDGTYTATVVPKAPGIYKLHITVETEPIQESPILMDVHEETDYSKLPKGENLFNTETATCIPCALAVDDRDNVYVLDSQHHCISVFRTTGKALTIGCKGSKDGKFDSPQGIAIHKDMLYVTDSGNHRVQMLTLTGVFKCKFGTKGSGKRQFDFPSSICVDSDGLIFVSDDGNHRIYIFKPGLILWRVFNIHKEESKDVCGLASDFGYLHILHTDSQISIYTSNGDYVTQYKIELSNPTGIVINEEGFTIVAGPRYNSWLSTWIWIPYSYLAVIDSNQTQVRHDTTEYQEEVTGIATDKRGNIYVCSGSSIYRHSYLK